jgi:hypothetical protein
MEKMKKDMKIKMKTNWYKWIVTSALIILILFYGTIYVSAAYERVSFNDGLYDQWHPGAFCIPCHYSLMSLEKAQSISSGCKCHNYRPNGEITGYKVDMANITEIHKDIICIRCHIGMKDQKNISAQDFHRIMPIACSNCHIYLNGTIQVPEKKNCSDCHTDGNPHVVHGTKIGELCIACHGEEFAKKYTNTTLVITEKNISIKTEIVAESPTITNFIYKILQMIAPKQ